MGAPFSTAALIAFGDVTHPLTPNTGLWGMQRAPYPTNAEWMNLVLGAGKKSINILPYVINVTDLGFDVSVPKRVATSTSIVSAVELDLSFRSGEIIGARSLTGHDLLSVTMQWSAGVGKTLTAPLVRGMPYATALYTGITPFIASPHGIVKVNGAAPSPTMAVMSDHFEVELNNKQKWVIYAMVERESRCPVSRYLDPAELDRERAVLYRKFPLIVGHASRLQREGDHFTHDDTGTPILVVHGKDGQLRALLNVCRHRGTRVEPGPEGSGKKAFVCPYHGWTYDTSGALLHIPHEEGFPCLDRAAMGLVSLPLERRFGFLWVKPEPGSGIDVAGYVGEAIDRDLQGFGLDTHVVYRSTVLRRPLNWKLAIDIFLEAYHFKRAHADSIYPLFFDNVGLFDRFSPHLRDFFPKRSLSSLRGSDKASWRIRQHGNLLYYLFPNTLLLVQPDHVSCFHIFPAGLTESAVLIYTLVPEEPRDDKARRHWDKNNEILYSAVEEDIAMGASIQKGLASGANQVLSFGRFEQALDYFHSAIDEALGRPTALPER